MNKTTEEHWIDGREDKMVSTQPHRTRVFISYSHEDGEWLERLRVQLKPMERQGLIDCWDDTKIKPGMRWREEIEKALKSTKVAMLLISQNFLASDFIADNELPPLLEAAKEEGAVILSAIVSTCRFNETPSLSQFQTVNPPSKPLDKMLKGDQEEVFYKVTKAIEDALKNP